MEETMPMSNKIKNAFGFAGEPKNSRATQGDADVAPPIMEPSVASEIELTHDANPLFEPKRPIVVGCLELVIRGITIPEIKDSETIESSNDVFYYTHPVGVRVAGIPTMKTVVNLYKKVADGSPASMFGAFRAGYNKLCLEWGQIVRYMRARENNDSLTEDDFVFFLMANGGEFMLASVYRNSRGGRFSARFCELSNENISNIKGTIYAVVPHTKVMES